MNRRITVIAIVSLVITLGIGFYLVRSRFTISDAPATLILRSPTASNEILLRESVETNPAQASRSEVVRFGFINNGHIRVLDEPLWSDSPDIHFRSLYSREEWISDQVLRFVSSIVHHESLPAEISIRNETSKEIDYLSVSTEDIFLVLLIRPKSDLNFKTPSTNVQAPTISCNGRFADGQKIQQSTKVYMQPNTKSIYSILITESGVIISSKSATRE